MTGGALTVNVSVAVPVPPAFVADSVTVRTPAWVVVPEIRPVVESTISPVGRLAAPKLVGELFAAIW